MVSSLPPPLSGTVPNLHAVHNVNKPIKCQTGRTPLQVKDIYSGISIGSCIFVVKIYQIGNNYFWKIQILWTKANLIQAEQRRKPPGSSCLHFLLQTIVMF